MRWLTCTTNEKRITNRVNEQIKVINHIALFGDFYILIKEEPPLSNENNYNWISISVNGEWCTSGHQTIESAKDHAMLIVKGKIEHILEQIMEIENEH